MNKAFTFNQDKCVNCGACSAACLLYNEWDVKPRNVYAYNDQMLHDLPLVNISLACNHCEKPACLEGCPSGAFYRNDLTSAVILNEERCLGCRYCQWNCPYDAPKYSNKKRIIEKCDLCLKTDDQPACAFACPTGALSYKDISADMSLNAPVWFPSQKLMPALAFTGEGYPKPLKIIPSERFAENEPSRSAGSPVEWSLVIFSFLVMISVSIFSASLLNGLYPGKLFFSLLVAAGATSLFHLGKPLRAWRALSNPSASPLSREIYAFLLFSIISAAAVILRSPGLLLAGTISGLILAIIIDSVYFVPDKKAVYHSGQTFLSTLLLISYFTGNLLPFAFITIIKVWLSVRLLPGKDQEIFRFIRIAFLLLALGGLISGYALRSTSLTILILSAELTDRYLFYIDFKPENIRYLIEKNIKSHYYEKKRG
jgi:Fe-S-cluster-containing dehydrogenase component/DMSO reductase anchor subunit